ncbi:PTS sugar transporter subunit IIC/EAL domain-containing protein [Neobittarella massiliensis]|uniref:PTS sugar transporter subunit IIC/EAL domain-containing protein n=1 Tax=Neobittarella massiliensis (ex Bilen et al. 2018) TaxID=2041842 RepID=UPI0013EB8DF0|nr:EAL domain-containing protein [Neobittarella massiliensis]
MYEKLLLFIYKMERNPVFSSIKKGFLLITPAVLAGSVALLINSFPIPALQSWLHSFAGGVLSQLLDLIFDATIGFLSVYLVLAISYYYCAEVAPSPSGIQVPAMVTALACFVATFGDTLDIDCFGTIGVFTAMLCAVLATRLFLFLTGVRRGKPMPAGRSTAAYFTSVRAILPTFVCVLVFGCGHLLLYWLGGVGNLNQLISQALVSLFGGTHTNLGAGLSFTAVQNGLWVLGVHGGNALDQVAKTLLVQGDGAIITKSFLDTFASIGGSGSALCLVLALLLGSRQQRHRDLVRSSLGLSLFNINEILVFGLPVVLNPILALPFVLTPLVSTLMAYGAVALGLVPMAVSEVGWTTPVFFSGYLATGSWTGAVLQLAILVVGTLLYLPFVHLAVQLQRHRAGFMAKDLTERFRRDEQRHLRPDYLERADETGAAAKAMAAQLQLDVQNGQVPVFYQPQLDAKERVVGAEALLRWQYAGQLIYPPLAIALAQQVGCFDALTRLILHRVCRDIGELRAQMGPAFTISVNITAAQLDDTSFTEQIISGAASYGVNHQLVLEVTEESALGDFVQIAPNIELLRQNGIRMAIDDFGMGQTSLEYLRENLFAYVKLDGSLVQQVLHNPRCRDIVGSIVELGRALDFGVTAEMVETEETRQVLLELGCQYYQGYLYSPALPYSDFVDYCREQAERVAVSPRQ